MFMTEAQRDYLADLAGKKGERLSDTSDRSASWASTEIERLKLLPDVVFDEIGGDIDHGIEKRKNAIIGEVSKWTFQA